MFRVLHKTGFIKPDYPTGKIEELNAANAVKAISSGLSILHPVQKSPPTWVLALLEDKITKIDLLGPRTMNPEIVRKIQSELFANGVIQDFAEGRPLNWLLEFNSLLRQIRVQLSSCENQPEDLFKQVENVVHSTIDCNLFEQVVPPGQEQASPGLELVSRSIQHPDGTKERRIAEVTPDWAEFIRNYNQIAKEFKNLVSTAMEEGRVLVVNRTNMGSKLIAYSRVHEELNKFEGASFHQYLLSSELPRSWFLETESKRDRLHKALAWMERACKACLAKGKQATVGQLLQIATEEYGVAPDTLERAWRTIEFEGKPTGGNIAHGQRISINDIKAIE